ncbi:MAG: peroxiredoxin [Acidimicrobiia bacterium]|nr:peroxiredoxin [Acidimicrobiia bacterium]
MTLSRGVLAPEIDLEGTEGDPGTRRRFRLSEYRGQPVVLAFYPADASPVCTVQLMSYTADISQFEKVGAQVLALSPQSVEDHERFAAANGGFAFPLLADTEREAAEAFGTLGPLGFYRRSVFVIDAAGVVRYAHRSTAGLTFRPTEEIVEAVREASANH